MTQCDGSPAQQCVEAYLQGRLPELEARNFEDHYFDCPVCLEQVEAMEMAAVTVGRLDTPMPKPVRVVVWPGRVAAFGAIAATLLFAFAGLRVARRPQLQIASAPSVSQTSSAPAPVAEPAGNTEVASLADLSLPHYEAPRLRGEAGSAAFLAGMKAYAKRDCIVAVRSLAKVPASDEDAQAAEFYAGACQIHLRNLDAAVASLRKVATAGDSPQQEAALYSLAQVDLARSNAAAAQDQLQRTIALHGDFERRARAQLEKLSSLESRP